MPPQLYYKLTTMSVSLTFLAPMIFHGCECDEDTLKNGLVVYRISHVF